MERKVSIHARVNGQEGEKKRWIKVAKVIKTINWTHENLIVCKKSMLPKIWLSKSTRRESKEWRKEKLEFMIVSRKYNNYFCHCLHLRMCLCMRLRKYMNGRKRRVHVWVEFSIHRLRAKTENCNQDALLPALE